MAKKLVVVGAKLKCDQGTSQSELALLPSILDAKDKTVATILDFIPMVNIKAFGMCKTQSNPQVAAATSAAAGVLTPQPCIPVVVRPWSPGSEVSTIDGKKALTDDSKCHCTWTGEISITDPATDVETD